VTPYQSKSREDTDGKNWLSLLANGLESHQGKYVWPWMTDCHVVYTEVITQKASGTGA